MTSQSQHAERPRLPDIVIALVCGLSVAFTAIYFLSVPLASSMAGRRDFIAYWAAGRQLVHHDNPYDRVAIEKLEYDAGLRNSLVLMMRNPPWALALALPLGYMRPNIAVLVWNVGLLACLVCSVLMVKGREGTHPAHLRWLGFAFAPALLCLIMGQTSLIGLLGLALFLRFQSERPWLAGASLWLCSLKPQLFLPFALVLVLWIVVRREYRIPGGWAAAMALSFTAAWAVDHSVWSDYSAMMRSENLTGQFVPCLSNALRFWVRPDAVWLQYLPSLAGCIWAAVWFWRRRGQWSWTEDSRPLILVSLALSPYCWLYDQCLAIPALLGAAIAARNRWLPATLALLSLAIGIQLAMVRVTSGYFMWTAPAWLLWYLVARRNAERTTN